MYGSIAKGGAQVAFGSDWPVVTLDPRFGINMAVNRTTPEGTPPGGWYPREKTAAGRRDRRLHERCGVRVVRRESQGRDWRPAMLADIVVLSTDVFDLEPARVMDAVVTHTIVDGKVVYVRVDDEHGEDSK